MIGSLNGPLCIYLMGQILYNLVSGRGTINVLTKFENESVKGIWPAQLPAEPPRHSAPDSGDDTLKPFGQKHFGTVYPI